MRKLLLILLVLIPFILNATHLIGGEITYTCLGGNQYEIKVVIYRDCGPTNSNNTGFDNGGVISIYDMNNNLYDVIEHDTAVSELVVDEFTSECVTLPPELCVEKGTYTIVTSLPNNANGYQIVYQRCCRNDQVINIENPEDMGSSLVAYVPKHKAKGGKLSNIGELLHSTSEDGGTYATKEDPISSGFSMFITWSFLQHL